MIIDGREGCSIWSVSIFLSISLEPIQYSPQFVDSVAWLRDGVSFVGVDHKLRLHSRSQQCLMKGSAHRQRTAAVVRGVQDQSWCLHFVGVSQRAMLTHGIGNFPWLAALLP